MTHVGVPVDSPGAVGWAMAFDELAAYVRTNEPAEDDAPWR
jgi:hypothetical protein